MRWRKGSVPRDPEKAIKEPLAAFYGAFFFFSSFFFFVKNRLLLLLIACAYASSSIGIFPAGVDGGEMLTHADAYRRKFPGMPNPFEPQHFNQALQNKFLARPADALDVRNAAQDYMKRRHARGVSKKKIFFLFSIFFYFCSQCA
jgi:hypothetical protein